METQCNCEICDWVRSVVGTPNDEVEENGIWPPWRDPNYVLYGEDGTPIEYT